MAILCGKVAWASIPLGGLSLPSERNYDRTKIFDSAWDQSAEISSVAERCIYTTLALILFYFIIAIAERDANSTTVSVLFLLFIRQINTRTE